MVENIHCAELAPFIFIIHLDKSTQKCFIIFVSLYCIVINLFQAFQTYKLVIENIYDFINVDFRDKHVVKVYVIREKRTLFCCCCCS